MSTARLDLRHWLSAPHFEGREDRRIAATLHAICLTFIGAALLSTLAAFTLTGRPPRIPGLGIVGFALALLTTALVLVHHRRLRAASALIVAMVWAANTAGIVGSGGISMPSFSFYSVGIVAGGLLLGARAAIGMALLCAATGGVIGSLESRGQLPAPFIFYESTFGLWWIEVVHFGAVAGLVYVSVGRLREALLDANRSEAELAERNRELERTLAEKQTVQEAAARLQEAMDQTSDGVVVFDAEGRVRYSNTAFRGFLGGPERDLAGVGAHEAFGSRGNALAGEIVASLAAGHPWRGRIHPHAAQDPRLRLDTHFAPVTDADGAVVSYVGVMRDVTREAELEHQLLQAQKLEAIGQLAGGVAHDFNNLLVVIRGYADLLRRGLDDDPELREGTEQIVQAADQAAALTEQLLAFGRRQVRQPRVLDLNGVVRDAATLLRRLVRENVSLELDLARDLWHVEVDPSQIHQVLMNLAANARDAMPDGGRLALRTSNDADAQAVLLSVSDSGGGMDASTAERIFEPFFTTKGLQEGTGLGLASVYGIVEQCGGRIEVETAPGQGTTFHIRIPRCERAPDAARIEAPPGAAAGAGARLLVVEDQDGVRRLMRRILEREGFEVIAACDGRDALTRLAAAGGEVDLLLTDMTMPHMDGPTLATRLRERWPGLPVVYTSGYPRDDLVGDAQDDAATDFLAKPFTDVELVEALGRLLASRDADAGGREPG